MLTLNKTQFERESRHNGVVSSPFMYIVQNGTLDKKDVKIGTRGVLSGGT